jgi:hypothetical protein
VRELPSYCLGHQLHAKCAHCGRPVLPGEDGLKIDGDIFHASCFWKLSSGENIHTSQEVCAESRRLIEEARRQRRVG